ncbi:hypothetical protein [Saccharothrix obliqua]|uniref:hypothetical protein n=1 Tax=Saccharothrix obliqua TaxID=2861747 RepID=UPI001C5D398E|nr:hypothetical protein [Saccharothrix obliqua]MBW4721765.1 hypothetical protein [Saccharothrix obliqua]
MTRIAMFALLMALVAVVAPPTAGGDPLAVLAVTPHRGTPAESLPEEDSNREARPVAEPRVITASAQREGRRDPVRRSPAARDHPEPPVLRPADYPHPRHTPPALQVFRN